MTPECHIHHENMRFIEGRMCCEKCLAEPSIFRTRLHFRVHFQVNGTEDYFDVFADTMEQIRDLAAKELLRRNGTDSWSEEIR